MQFFEIMLKNFGSVSTQIHSRQYFYSNPFSHSQNASIRRISINNCLDETRTTDICDPFALMCDRQLGKPDVMNEQMTHPLKLHKFLHTHNVQIMTHHASQTRTTHHVDLALHCWTGLMLGQQVKWKVYIPAFMWTASNIFPYCFLCTTNTVMRWFLNFWPITCIISPISLNIF